MKKTMVMMLLHIGITAQGSEHAITLGGAWLDHSGLNALNLDRPANTLSEVSQSDIGWSLGYRWSGESWRVGISYHDHGKQDVTGVSPDSNLFGIEGAIPAQVLTPFTLNSDLSAVSLDVAYLIRLNADWLLELGPSLTVSHQDIRVTSEGGLVLRNTSRSDNHVGLMLGLQHDFSDHWQGQLQFRETRYNDLTVRQAGLLLAYAF